MEWKDPTHILETPISLEKAKISGSIVIGDPRLSCYETYKELKFLRNLVGALEDGQTVSWSSEGQVVEELLQLVEFCKVKGNKSAYDTRGDKTFNLIVIIAYCSTA